jgi:hypothetical protein
MDFAAAQTSVSTTMASASDAALGPSATPGARWRQMVHRLDADYDRASAFGHHLLRARALAATTTSDSDAERLWLEMIDGSLKSAVKVAKPERHASDRG